MKRNYIIGFFGLSAVALLGCPVFSGGGGGGTEPCGGGSYYGGSGSYICCTDTSECPTGSVCEANYCVASYEGGVNEGGEGGATCATLGCGKGEICAVQDGTATCIKNPDGGGGKDAASDAPPFKGCTSDAACADAGTGYLCLDGTCVAPANQCTDTTQCPNSEKCVAGACVPGCSSSSSGSCDPGYSCDVAAGVCTGNPTPCGAADGGMACGKGTTCVDEHCVPKCSTGDAACGAGLVCVDNGCIPDQKPVFFCDKSGTADGTQDKCDPGSICLHHNCYIACGGDSGVVCSTEAGGMFPVCKPVTTSSGVHNVCATTTNLGSDCDPTTTPPKTCSGGQICIDGYCL